MKLICLNVWGGKVYKPLMKFFKNNKDADVFCLQEVFRSEKNKITDQGLHLNIFADIEKVLPEHTGYFAPTVHGLAGYSPPYFVDFDLDFGQAIFVKKSISVAKHGRKTVFKGKKKIKSAATDIPRIVDYVQINTNPDLSKNITIFNFHGLAMWPKTDNNDRLMQSKLIRECMDAISGEKIVCGDFNLAPETKSLAMVGKGMRDLIGENKIKSTRSRLFKKEYLFSDYMFASAGINVKKFTVPHSAVSDHLPLVLEFDF